MDMRNVVKVFPGVLLVLVVPIFTHFISADNLAISAAIFEFTRGK